MDHWKEANKRQRTSAVEDGEFEESSEEEEPGDHSSFDKLNEYALEYLLSFLPLQELKNCRLVNHLWNRLILGLLPKRSHYIPIIYWHPRPGENMTSLEDVPQLLQTIRSSAHFPWTKFEVDGRLAGTAEEQEMLAGLFQGISPFVTKLWIYALRKHLFPEKFQYPALKCLQLHCLESKKPDAQNLREFILGVVEGAPKLETLCLNGCYMITHFMKILESPYTRRINRLLLSSVIENKHLIQLSQLGFQLKHLTLQFAGKQRQTLEIGAGPIRTFLETQRRSLEKLQFGEVAEDQNIDLRVEFPRMEKLSYVKVALPGKYPNLSISQQLPKLRKLEFWFYEPGYPTLDYWFHSEMQPVETVEELKFTGDMTNPEIILQAGRQFPNLWKLQVLASAQLLEAVGQSMPKLKHLTLLFMEEEDEDVDHILTGVSPETCQKLRKLPPGDTEEILWFERSWKLRPCFQNLTKLELVADRQVGISDVGCRLVLLRMKHLQNLQIVGYCSRISQEVLAGMRKQFGIHYGNK